MHSPGYSATKAGVISLTKTTAYDVAGGNIYVNAIDCGGVMTPPFEAYLATATEQQENSLFQRRRWAARRRRNTPRSRCTSSTSTTWSARSSARTVGW